MEPTTTAASGVLLSKWLYGLAGLFGATSVAFFWQPKKLREHGKLTAGAIVGGLGAVAPVMLGAIIARYFGYDETNPDVALAIGYIGGASSIGVIGMIAAFFEKREGKDIVEVAQEVRSAVAEKPVRKAPVRKSTPKKAPAKKRVAK